MKEVKVLIITTDPNNVAGFTLAIITAFGSLVCIIFWIVFIECQYKNDTQEPRLPSLVFDSG